MTSPGFLPSSEVERFLRFARPELREIALEVRNLVSAAAPDAEERILWGGLSYHDPRKGGPVKGAICQIGVDRDRVRIGFIHGVRLDDPQGLLRGDRLSKRFVPLASFDDAPWDAVEELIACAAGLDPSSFEAPLSTPE